MRVLLIGGTRFIGPPVVRELIGAGHEVAVFHRGESETELPEEVRTIRGDRKRLLEYGDDFQRFAPDVVVDMISLNESDANGLVETFRGVASRTVVISSMDVYRAYDIVRGLHPGPPDPTPLTEESPLRERLYPYDRPGVEDYEKILVERAATSDRELPSTVLRLPAVYGPGDYQRRIYTYLKRMDDGRPTILLEENVADWRWTMGYVEDVAHAICIAATDGRATGRIYNVGEPDALTQTEVVRAVADTVGWDGEILPAPTGLLPEYLRVGLEDTGQDFTVSSSRIRAELGYEELFAREEALRRTVEWDLLNPPQNSPDPLDYATEDEAIAKVRASSHT